MKMLHYTHFLLQALRQFLRQAVKDTIESFCHVADQLPKLQLEILIKVCQPLSHLAQSIGVFRQYDAHQLVLRHLGYLRYP